jgi:hypothetical protein
MPLQVALIPIEERADWRPTAEVAWCILHSGYDVVANPNDGIRPGDLERVSSFMDTVFDFMASRYEERKVSRRI